MPDSPDDPLRSSEPHYTRPTVNLVLIAINVAVFLYELSLGNGYRLNHFIALYGIVPDRLNVASIFTSMFIHGGWLHILGNMWFLWVFGRGIEDVLGHAKYLFFYLVCGVAAAIAHILVNSNSTVPTIGASGAIAGVMGAYLVTFPRARVVTLVILFIFITTVIFPPRSCCCIGSPSNSSMESDRWDIHKLQRRRRLVCACRRVYHWNLADQINGRTPPSSLLLLRMFQEVNSPSAGIAKPLDILAIAAHPDDIEQTCGGTLIRMAEAGYRTGALDLTAGDMGTRGNPRSG